MSVYQQIIKYLHTQKKKLDPLTMYMLMLNKDYFYYYCLLHPEVFTDNELYQQFIRLYVLNHSFRRETIDYYHGGQSADFDFNLNNHLRDKLNYKYNRIRNNRDINHNINIELNIQKEQNDDQKNLFDKYKNHHEKNLEKIPEDTSPDDIDDLSKVQKILDKYNKKLDKLEKKVNKDLENRVGWTQERMKQKNRSKFKIWLQTPNPQTRHTSNDGQIVPLDEKFIIVNDKTGDIDYLDYPGDSKGSIGNIANCLCTLGFDKDITPEQLKKYKDYEKTRKQQKDKAQEIKFNIFQNKYYKTIYKNNTKTQEQLKQQYIQEHGKLPSYVKNTNEYMFKEDKNRVYMIHIFGNKNELIVDETTKKSKNKLYNRISKYFDATKEKYEHLKENNPKLFKSLQFYTGDGFALFNGWKRDGRKYLENNLNINSNDIDKRIKKYKTHEENLKTLLVPLEEDLVLYRGQNNLYHSILEGTIAKWNSFTSTSLDVSPAFKYSNGNYIYEIHIPRGKEVIPILQQGENPKETELLLPPDTQFEVGKIRVQNGIKILPITIL